MKTRAAQTRFLRLVDIHRLVAFLARRQFGKTTTLARIALRKMMRLRDHTIIFGSAKLQLSTEIARKEAGILQTAIRELIAKAKTAQAGLLTVINSETGKPTEALTLDDFAGLYVAQRLEFRYYHDRGSYSRTKIVALRADTVGETGDLMLDEIGRVKNFVEVWEAVEPIIQSNPDFRCILATTPAPDDTHFSYPLLAAPIGIDFPPNPEGNLYLSDLGVQVLRVDAWDAALDGVPLYDISTGEPLDPAEHRRRAHDKDAWDRNYGCRFVIGGTGACGIMQLDTAQRRGVGKCTHFNIGSDLDFECAVAFVTKAIGPGAVGLGWDLATTTKATSNPSAFAVVEKFGVEYIIRALVTWKTASPALAKERARRLIDAVKLRPAGGPARKLCIDATNERYFATECRDEFASLLPVELVIASETTQPPGYEAPITQKQLLGDLLVGELDDNHLTLPPERYVKEDFRLVKKERGQFICEPDSEGRHGDTFDASKLSLRALAPSSTALFTPIPTPRDSERALARQLREVYA